MGRTWSPEPSILYVAIFLQKNNGYYNIHYEPKSFIRDIMIATIFMTPDEMARHIATQARERRLSLNMSQRTLSERSGVSYAVIKKFESTGKIALQSLLKIAIIVDALEDFATLFAHSHVADIPSLDVLMKKNRRRGRA